MEIIGRGMIATALRQLDGWPEDCVAYATGVADSGCTDQRRYNRDYARLLAVVERCVMRDLRLVYFSSASQVLLETAYGEHKRRCERLIQGVGGRYLICRLANVVGPTHNRTQLVPNLVGQILSMVVKVQRYAARDLLGVDRLAATIAALVPTVEPREIVIVRSGHSSSVATIVDEIANILDIKPSVLLVSSGGRPIYSVDGIREMTLTSSWSGLAHGLQVLRRYVPGLAQLRWPGPVDLAAVQVVQLEDGPAVAQ